jgi:hypothetical protein
MKTSHNILKAATFCACLLAGGPAGAIIQVAERYDFGLATSPTQAGFTAVTFAQKYDGVNSGFDPSNLSFGSFNRDPSIWSAQAQSFITQTNLQRDGIYGRSGGISLVWRDVLPDGASNAVVTVWLGDPADQIFVSVTARAAHQGVTNLIGTWTGGSVYVTNLTGSVGPLGGSGTLDVLLSVNLAGETSAVRWSGLEITYTLPEPGVSTLLMLAVMGAVLGSRRRYRKQ